MADSEPIVTEASAATGYESATYPSTDYLDVNISAASGAGALATENVGDLAVNATSTKMEDANVSAGIGANNAMASGSDADAAQHVADANALDTNEKLPGLEGAPVDASQASASDVSLNGNNAGDMGGISSADVAENGIISDGVHGTATVHQTFDASALSAEEERLWSVIRSNSLDFSTWTALIEETEKMSEGNIMKIRKVYDTFLAEFPLCYGYWKKYADHEASIGSMDKVVEVYERAVQGVTYSVDMWLHYCVFAISTYGDPETIRRLFERGLAYVGTDYLSFPLWDKYIEYEYMQQDWSRVAMLYTRVFENPNLQLDHYFEGFKELVASHPLSELRSAEEAAAAALENSRASGQEIEGELHPNSVEQYEPVSASLKDAEELEKYIAIREEIYKKAKEFDTKIIGFETAIRRPYFHVRPLNVAELENWHTYLDFIEGIGDLNKLRNICCIICLIG